MDPLGTDPWVRGVPGIVPNVVEKFGVDWFIGVPKLGVPLPKFMLVGLEPKFVGALVVELKVGWSVLGTPAVIEPLAVA